MPANSAIREITPPQSGSKKRKRTVEEPENLSALHENQILIYSWNINGISPFLQPSVASYFKSNAKSDISSDANPRASLRAFLRRHKWPTILFLQEVKINANDAATIRAVQNAVARSQYDNDDEPDYVAHFELPKDRFNAKGFGGKVYGVCSIIRKDFSSRFVRKVRSADFDQEGRFQVVETDRSFGMPKAKLAIINIYGVNGTENAYKSPQTGQIIGTRHDRKLQVHALLQAEVRRLVADGFEVIIAGDLNIARSPLDGHPNLRTFPQQHCVNRADFEAKFFDSSIDNGESNPSGGLGMIDSFRHLHPKSRGYTYYPRTKEFGASCDRVDMILLSPALRDALVAAGIHENVQERGPSDHVPLYVELQFGAQS